MKPQLEVVYTWTQDELRLQGMHYTPANKDAGVIFIHGMSGNFIDNVFAGVLGQTLADNGYGFIYGHNRGWGQINDLAKKSIKSDNGYESARHGAIYERFQSCPYDIDAWVVYAQTLGYKRLILIGHSLGCPKLLYWWFKRKPKNIQAVILASPADMTGLAQKGLGAANYQALIKEAQGYVKQGKYSQILSQMIDGDWLSISAQTFLDEMVDHCPADVLPVLRNPAEFPELSSISVPTLCFYGEYDSAVIKSPLEDLKLLKTKATGSPDFQTAIIPGANHNYENREQAFADAILNWIRHSIMKI
jgi:pimeloyl-ACP methyl ester carboxylesterase